MPDLPPPRRHLLEGLILAAAFAVAHTQSPLYYSNQNQYLLHGLALAGEGHLSADWLANTRDPTPLFSWLVAATYTAAGGWGLQVAYFLLLMGYFLSVRWLVAALPGLPDTRPFRLAFAALFTLAHAALPRVLSVALAGVDYPWYFQAGLASQYLLGPGLQPSAFGVLLVASLASFAHGRLVLAGALAAGSVLFHSTYGLHAGLLTAAYLLVLAGAGRWRTAGITGAVALLVVAPTVVYSLIRFAPTDSTTFAEAQRLLAEVRIPHHCVIRRWFDAIAALQLLWMVVGLALLRRTPLFLPLLVPSTVCLVLSLIQNATGDPTLALLFPWRFSVLLVPVATAVMAAKLAALLPPKAATWAGGVLLAALAIGGVVVMAAGLGYRVADEEALFAYVRENAKPGDVYLLPVKFPAVGTGRGAVSNTFAPPPRPKPGSNQIPVDLLRFRLHTGTPIYVDFKSVPYADVEVLEWHRRMKQCEAWYAGDWTRPGVRDELIREGITHVVAPRNVEIAAPYLEEVHRDESYVVYRVK